MKITQNALNRLKQEHETVNENYRTLKLFIDTFPGYKNVITPVQQSLHKIQLSAMDTYREVLEQRILWHEKYNNEMDEMDKCCSQIQNDN